MTAAKTEVSSPCRGPNLISLPKGAGNLPMVKAQAVSALTMKARKQSDITVTAALTPTVSQ